MLPVDPRARPRRKPAGRDAQGSIIPALAGMSSFNWDALRSVVCSVPLGKLAVAMKELPTAFSTTS